MLVSSGCTSTAKLLGDFAEVVADASPFVAEPEAWEAYSIEKTQQGVSYATASSEFVSHKMENEYTAAIDRLSRLVARTEKSRKELDEANQDYRFTYHHIMTVKDKKTADKLGYCVSYDSERVVNGTVTDPKENVFIYVARDKPLSVATVSHDFIKLMCGESFYNKYK